MCYQNLFSYHGFSYLGSCEKRISEGAERYKLFKEEHEKSKKNPPESDGVLIFVKFGLFHGLCGIHVVSRWWDLQ